MMDFDNFCTIVNRNEYSTKRVQTVSLGPYYVSTLPGKTKNSTKRPTAYTARSVESIVPNFCRKSFNVHFFPYLLENSFSCFLTENLLHYHGFYQKFILQLNMVNIKI